MILLVQTYPGGNNALRQNWPYIQANSGAEDFVIITTKDGDCWVPEGINSEPIGGDKYIDGTHLPTRLIDTLEFGLTQSYDHIMVCEYDVVFFHPIPYKKMERAVASHLAGGKTWSSLANSYYHNPWLFKREFVRKFIEVGRENLDVCTRKRTEPSTPESSPDVFFGYVCEKMNQPVQDNLWLEYSQNSLDRQEYLDSARLAYRAQYHCIHGVKTKAQLDFILS